MKDCIGSIVPLSNTPLKTCENLQNTIDDLLKKLKHSEDMNGALINVNRMLGECMHVLENERDVLLLENERLRSEVDCAR